MANNSSAKKGAEQWNVVLMLLAFIFLSFGYFFYLLSPLHETRGGKTVLIGSIGGGLGGETQSDFDNYPWINTVYYDTSRDASTYTGADVQFLADHFDITAGRAPLTVKQINPDLIAITFNSLASLGRTSLNFLQQFFAENPQYAVYPQSESVFLHYKCDTTVNDILVRGCNLLDEQTGACSGIAATGCGASSAQLLSDSRVPDSIPLYQAQGAKFPNFKSETYKAFGVWRSLPIISSSDGMWWDNILYLPGYVKNIQNTIEYFGQPEPPSSAINGHQYNSDYNAYFNEVKNRVEQETGRNLIWVGNVNAMFWIRESGPYINWVLNNLDYFSPESWLSPLAAGEYNMPFWAADCSDLKEVWDYSFLRNNHVLVLTYNSPSDTETRKFSIAKYYLVKNPLLYYGYRENMEVAPLSAHWNNVAELDIGKPRVNPLGVKDFAGAENTDKFFDWNSPSTQLNCTYFNWSNVVFARHFENGLVLARWKGQRSDNPPPNDPTYNSRVDPKTYSLSNPYGSSYYIIQSDGTLSQNPVTEVTLRTNEAVVLMNVIESPPPPPPPVSFNLTVSKTGTGRGVINSIPAGINCGSDCEENYNSGAQVALTAIPESDSIFGGWSGACSGTGSCSLTMSSELSVSVIFNLRPGQPLCYSGESRSCQTGSCSGNQICANGAWNDCVKVNACCGVNCNDNDSCTTDSCAGGVCSHANICPPSPPLSPLPPPPVSVCGNGICETSENYINCRADCFQVSPQSPSPPGHIDIERVNEVLTQVGRSAKTILYILSGIAVLVFIIALF